MILISVKACEALVIGINCTHPDFGAELVEQVSGWDIRVDAGDEADGKIGERCFMQRDFDSGIRFQIGLWPARDGAFVAAYSKEDKDFGRFVNQSFDLNNCHLF